MLLFTACMDVNLSSLETLCSDPALVQPTLLLPADGGNVSVPCSLLVWDMDG